VTLRAAGIVAVAGWVAGVTGAFGYRTNMTFYLSGLALLLLARLR
jgi:hypothetical protein